jgi:transcriptional regulator GlxA family with amidase domain
MNLEHVRVAASCESHPRQVCRVDFRFVHHCRLGVGYRRDQGTNTTKSTDKTAVFPEAQIEVGLACDEGSSSAGIHGLTDLLRFASGFAARRQNDRAVPPIRVTHWQVDARRHEVCCTFDSDPRPTHGLSVLVIPGNEQAPSADPTDTPLLHWLREKHSEGVVVAAVCGGVFILARSGLLAGRQATTHWAFNEEFSLQFPDVLTETDRMVIDYGDVLTAGGVLAWADLGLRLVERFLGPMVMLDTARFMNIDPPGREQQFYSDFVPKTKHGDSAILKAQQWLSTQREHAISVTDIARHACLEPRTLLRRFVSATGMKPSEYQQRLRITRAREMLEFSRTRIDEIAAKVGYDDVGGFRRVFRKIVGLTPSEYRQRFCRITRESR